MSPPDATEIVELARNAGVTLGSAESLTGGAVSAAITAVPGASDVWRGAIIAYHSDVKRDLLGVPASVLDQVGVVSLDTALAMAHGARARLGVDFAVSTTGVAGPLPHGGRAVGTVVIGIVGPGVARAHEDVYVGDRDAIVARSVAAALATLATALGGGLPREYGSGEQL